MISPYEAAYALCEMSGWTLTNLRLQKMLYLLQSRYLRTHGDEPLIHDTFETRNNGPVMLVVYDKLKQFGTRPIKNMFYDVRDIHGTAEYEYIKSAFMKMSALTDAQLYAVVHNDAVWKQYRADGEEVSNEEILRPHQGCFMRV